MLINSILLNTCCIEYYIHNTRHPYTDVSMYINTSSFMVMFGNNRKIHETKVINMEVFLTDRQNLELK